MKANIYDFKYFHVSEFFCNCSESEIAQCVRNGYMSNCFSMLHHLDDIRLIYRNPIRITSGYRDFNHNRRIGGSCSSQHKVGLAVDYQPLEGDLRPLLDATIEYNSIFNCIGQMLVAVNYIHIGLLGDTSSTDHFSIKFYDTAKVIYKDKYELLKSDNYPVE